MNRKCLIKSLCHLSKYNDSVSLYTRQIDRKVDQSKFLRRSNTLTHHIARHAKIPTVNEKERYESGRRDFYRTRARFSAS